MSMSSKVNSPIKNHQNPSISLVMQTNDHGCNCFNLWIFGLAGQVLDVQDQHINLEGQNLDLQVVFEGHGFKICSHRINSLRHGCSKFA